MNKSRFGRSSRRLSISSFLLLCLILLALGGCKGSGLEYYASELKGELKKFAGQKSDSVKSYEEAYKAKVAAMKADFKYNDPRTKAFIAKWEDAAGEVVDLRKRFNDVLESADFFFAYSEKKAIDIKDVKLKRRMLALVQRKKNAFANSCRKSNRAIASLEKSMQRGNDIIAALEITGALGSVEGKVNELDALHDIAIAKLPAIDGLVKDGMKILNTELKNIK